MRYGPDIRKNVTRSEKDDLSHTRDVVETMVSMRAIEALQKNYKHVS